MMLRIPRQPGFIFTSSHLTHLNLSRHYTIILRKSSIIYLSKPRAMRCDPSYKSLYSNVPFPLSRTFSSKEVNASNHASISYIPISYTKSNIHLSTLKRANSTQIF